MNTKHLNYLLVSSLFLLVNCKTEELLKVTKLQTGEITDITATTAKASGTFVDVSEYVNAYGHCWNTAGNPTIADYKFEAGTEAKKGSYYSDLTGLIDNTKYFVRAYALDNGEALYSEEVNFTTEPKPSIKVISPESTDHWVGNESHKIKWTSVNVEGNVNISLKSENFDSTLFIDVPCSLGERDWTIPKGKAYKKDYFIRIVSINDGNVYDESPIFMLSEPSGTIGTLQDFYYTYHSIKIGKQWWMAENLKNPSNVHIICEFDSATWSNLASPARCYYDNYENNIYTYGYLYNWYAVNTGLLCPTGWHVPTDTEWTTLTDYVGGEVIAGGLLKETGTIYWNAPNFGTSNTYGFAALPGGVRSDNGSFYNLRLSGNWWSNTKDSLSNAFYRNMSRGHGEVGRNDRDKRNGMSIRCIKD